MIYDMSEGSEPDSVSSEFSMKPGWSAGGGLDWNVSDRISLSADLIFSHRVFQKTTTKVFDFDKNVQIAKLTWLDIPFYLKYQDYTGQLRPYGYLGYALHLNLLAKGQYSSLNIEESGVNAPTEGSDVVFTNKQNFVNRSFVLGGGLKYKIGKNYLFADLRLQLGLSNVTNPSKIIGDTSVDESITKYNITRDMYRVNSITLSVGYVIPFYDPRKKGGWEPKGFLGKILYGNK